MSLGREFCVETWDDLVPRMEKLAHAKSQLLMGGGHVAKKRRWG